MQKRDKGSLEISNTNTRIAKHSFHMTSFSMLLQSPLYGFNLTDAHKLYHTDILHQSDKGILESVMKVTASFFNTQEREQVDEAIMQLKGFPNLNLPKVGFADLDSKRTATQTAHLFASLSVPLLALMGCHAMLVPCIWACSGDIIAELPAP